MRSRRTWRTRWKATCVGSPRSSRVDMTQEDKTSASDNSDVEDWWRGDRNDVLQRIDTLRDEIDRLDEVLVRLLNARARCALKIGGLKKLLELEIYQPQREE